MTFEVQLRRRHLLHDSIRSSGVSNGSDLLDIAQMHVSPKKKIREASTGAPMAATLREF